MARVAQVIVDLSFMLAVVLTFFTGFYKEGTLVFTNHLIAKHYFRGWFTVDFISSIPLDTISIISGVEIHAILRLNKAPTRRPYNHRHCCLLHSCRSQYSTRPDSLSLRPDSPPLGPTHHHSARLATTPARLTTTRAPRLTAHPHRRHRPSSPQVLRVPRLFKVLRFLRQSKQIAKFVDPVYLRLFELTMVLFFGWHCELCLLPPAAPKIDVKWMPTSVARTPSLGDSSREVTTHLLHGKPVDRPGGRSPLARPNASRLIPRAVCMLWQTWAASGGGLATIALSSSA